MSRVRRVPSAILMSAIALGSSRARFSGQAGARRRDRHELKCRAGAYLAGLVLVAVVPATLLTSAASATTTSTDSSTTATLNADAAALGFDGSTVFSDDFSGTSINTANWNLGVASKAANGIWNGSTLPGGYTFSSVGAGANDQEYFSSQNISVDNGLTLSAVPDQSQPGFSYRSAAVSTYGKDPVSGTVLWEIDAKMPDSSSGMWPGIWFLPDSTAVYPAGQRTDEGEIDLFEGGYTQGSANPNTVLAMHYGGATSVVWHAPGTYPIVPDLSAGYHVYGLKFVPGVSITYYLDGQQMWQVTSNVSSLPHELLLDLQVASSQTSGWHTQTGPDTPAVSDFDIAQVAEYSASSPKTLVVTQVPAAQLPEAPSLVLFPTLGLLGFAAYVLSGRRRGRHSAKLVR
jgi:hypothetical protein